jgi:hypothetical protein
MIQMIFLYQNKLNITIYKLLGFLLFFFLLKSDFVKAQTSLKEKNHVILLIDRSAEMQPERGERIWNDVFKHLNSICFDSINGKRPLLIPKQDYLSIVAFGKNFENNLNNYITQDKFGYTYNKDFTSQSLNDFKKAIEEIGWRERNGGFFCFKNAYYSIAIPYALKFLGKNYRGERFQNTFLILISDKVPNMGNYETSEFQSEGSYIVNLVNEVRIQLNKNYILNLKKTYSKDFKRQEDYNDRSGEKYHVEVFTLEPKQQLIFDNIIKHDPLLELSRFPGYYKGTLAIKHQPNNLFKTEKLDIIYSVNGKQVQKESITNFDNKNSFKSTLKVPDFVYGSNIKIKFHLTSQFKNNYYPGFLLTGFENENLAREIVAKFEQKHKILGITTLSDSLFSFLGTLGIKSQSGAITIVNIALVLIALLLFITLSVIIIKNIAKRPYKPQLSQFEFEILNDQK